MKFLPVLLAAVAATTAMVPANQKPPAGRDDGFTPNPLRHEDVEISEDKPGDQSPIPMDLFNEYLASGRIVGGEIENPKNSNPWQVLVHWGGICGGTLIDSKFVLTAAHCIPSNLNTTSYIIAGAHAWCSFTSTGNLMWNTEPTQQLRKVKKLHRLDGNLAYGSKGQLFDIAIIEVDTPYTLNNNVVLAKLPIQRTPVGTNVIVSGWGDTTEGGDVSCNLRQVSLPIVSKTDCNAVYGGIKTSQICAGPKEGGKDSCQGDSGGPLVIKRSSTDATVVGVVSFGRGCARPNVYGVYTDVYTFLPWIRSVLSGSTWTSCQDSRTNWIGDNYCDNEMNSQACLYDAGDCCNNTFQGWNNYCGSTCTCKEQ